MDPTPYSRTDGRMADNLRPTSFTLDIAPAAGGSVLVRTGRTTVICGVTVEDKVPGWMRAQNVAGGWITAEYSMLPYSVADRARREKEKTSGRTAEIQRLIGRSMRMAVDLERLGSRTLWIDCDVLEADGGTRTASITGAWVALRLAMNRLLKEGRLEQDPIRRQVAAVSVGVVDGAPLLDLNYVEDFAASVDMNVVMDDAGHFIEVQGTAESAPFDRAAHDQLVGLAEGGIVDLMKAQNTVLETASL